MVAATPPTRRLMHETYPLRPVALLDRATAGLRTRHREPTANGSDAVRCCDAKGLVAEGLCVAASSLRSFPGGVTAASAEGGDRA